MSKELVIVESPSKAKTIGKILGKEYIVKASVGHVRDLPVSKLGVDVKKNFEPKYELTKNGKKIIAELKKIAKGCEKVYLAPDPDREGEAIAWHLYESLKKGTKAEFRRVTFHEITKSAVSQAFEDSHEIDTDRVDAQQARRVLDRIVGYQVSPILWRRGDGAKSAGRVQTVALRMICERERAITSFVPEEYWTLKADFAKDTKEQFTASLAKLDGKKPSLPDEVTTKKLTGELEGAEFSVAEVASKERRRNAPPPFITSTLQQAASSSIRMQPQRTMRIAQSLYEGVEVGDGEPAGLITYMRTDSVNIAKEASDAAREFIGSDYGKEYVPEKPNVFKTKGSAQAAHEAIRPTRISFTPEQAKKYLDAEQLSLYTLIWKRFIACQMAPAIFRQDSVDIKAHGSALTHEYIFRCTASINIFPGYLKLYNIKEDDEKEEENSQFPELKEGEKCGLEKFITDQHFTEPPPRFSEATLIKELEAKGVGRPSTYSSIVSVIQEREYVTKDKGRLTPSAVGFDVCDFLVVALPDLFEVGFTAAMEDKLDNIESGDQIWTAMLGDFYGDFKVWLDKARTAGAPPQEHFLKVIDIFGEDIKWAEPEKVGRKVYDDHKFVVSLKEDYEKGLSLKQWQALIRIAVKYEDQLPTLTDLIVELDAQDAVAVEKERLAAIAKSKADFDPAVLRLLSCFEKVEFAEPNKVGKRTYDDKKFVASLQRQADSGKAFSPAQMNALKRLVMKYAEQISNFKELEEEFGFGKPPGEGEIDKTTEALVKLFEQVSEWAEPVKRRGRLYDDKDFVESVTQQFKINGSLSDRQVAAIRRTLGKYQDQIATYDSLAEELQLPQKKVDE